MMPQGRNLLVLVVDDSPAVRIRIRLMLEELGFHVVEAADGKEALDRVKENPPELILLDLEMPVMDGMTFLKRYHQTGKGAPVIVCSTLNNMTKIMEAIENGAAEYIMKPFDESILFGKLELITMGKP